jgi:hypothetical protein
MLAHRQALSADDSRRLEDHLACCPACTAASGEYARQDEALRALPVLAVPPRLSEAVLQRTTRRPAPARAVARRWVPVTALALALFLALSFGTIEAAGRSLPGDLLYPVKLTVEQARLALLRSEAARGRYLDALRSQRLAEVREVVALGRTAEVEFEGRYEGSSGAEWSLDALRVGVPAGVWEGAEPPLGSAVHVRAHVMGGTVEASQVDVAPGPAGDAGGQHAGGASPPGTAEPSAGPSASPAEPTPMATAAPPGQGQGHGAGGGQRRGVDPVTPLPVDPLPGPPALADTPAPVQPGRPERPGGAPDGGPAPTETPASTPRTEPGTPAVSATPPAPGRKGGR